MFNKTQGRMLGSREIIAVMAKNDSVEAIIFRINKRMKWHRVLNKLKRLIGLK